MSAVANLRSSPRSSRRGRRVVWAELRPLLFRLCLGRWPAPREALLFNAGLRDRATKLPACCRAMLAVPEWRVQISRMVLVDMARSGGLVLNDPFGVATSSEPPPHSGDPLRFWHGPPVAFLHLEKTAGVSLAKLLTQMFHPQQIDPDPHRTVAPHLRVPFAGRPAPAIRRHALIFGHYDLPSLHRLDPGRTVITMLRNPADRILSLYYYWRSIDLSRLPAGAAHAAVRLAHCSDLLEFLGSDDPLVRDHIDNFYVRRLTGIYLTGASSDRLSDAPDAVLKLALQGLRRIDFVGITEEMAPSVAALAGFLGFVPPDQVPMENTAAANAAGPQCVFRPVSRESLTPAHRQQLGRLTRLDTVVYRVACERFATHRGVVPNPYHSQSAIACYGAA